MIVIAAALALDPANVDDFLAVVRPLVVETLKEDGCVDYGFWRDLDEPNAFHIFEEWESEEALTAHSTTPHIKTFRRAIRDLGVTRMDIYRYEATSKTKLR
jgi:quinol monooxygenase YgiN